MAKSYEEYLHKFSQGELFGKLLDDPGFVCKPMFGGLACYLDGLMIACLVESLDGANEWKGKTYSFPIWYGILLPTSREFHDSLFKEIPGLISHPVLGKWLYLSLESEDYDDSSKIWLRLAHKRDPRIGVPPGKPKSRKTKGSKKLKRSSRK